MSREGIFNRCQREPKERQETRTKRIREFDVRRTKNLLLVTSENRVPTVVSLGPVVAPSVFARVKSSRNRFRRFETSSRVNAFRVFALLEFVPISFPARAFASRTPARTLVVSFRARGKKRRENSPAALLLSSLARETRVYGPFVCATC